MIRIRLSDQDARRLEDEYRRAKDRPTGTASRSSCWPTGAGPHQDIAADLGIHRRTVQRWLNAYLERGLDGLRPRKAKGSRGQASRPTWPTRSAAGSSRGRPSRGWTGPTGPTRSWPTTCSRPTASGPAARPCSGSAARSASGPYRPTYRFLRGDPDKQAEAREDLAELEKGAEAGELVLLSQDEARFPMVPTLAATLGVKGHRPVVGTRDCKDLLYVFAVVNLVTGGAARQHAGEPGAGQAEDRARARPGGCRRRSPPTCGTSAGCTRPSEHKRVVLIIDNAPWHRGKPIDEALADNPHLEFYRLPSYSPQLNVIERFWKKLRRRATHNRLFDTPGRPEAVAPGQPLLLPDGAGAGAEPDRRLLHPPRKTGQHQRACESGGRVPAPNASPSRSWPMPRCFRRCSASWKPRPNASSS